MQTARLLGGDYYDFFKIADDTVDVVIADVSAKAPPPHSSCHRSL